ncbi:YbaB/EbfC family nucleoid-associated protein [Actinomyces sp. HMSC035G02]|uniref:YbaB/EbfC family nucleoid-associated protein n=1 Tax=Actinomyces sp. HMSC035G02 TaxID=1739406 RepID=UPI0008A8F345|nr:YbaB/EbfC family nucleoid-associated protein [Actinomyces sp. HMSC035G02]OHR23724.1 DNA-binding protein [Actinomyces sp. HMSC035G02]
MVDVMGRTPEEFEEMLNAQIAEAERRAAAMDEFVTTLESARVTGFDSRREVEVEINQEGAMTRVSIDDEALEGSTSDLEEAIMEAYSDAGKNMSRFLREQGDRQFGGGESAMGEFVDQISSRLEQLGR